MNYTYNADAFRRVFEKSFTWISGFMCNVRRSPGKTALIDSLTDRSWTYSELNDDVNRFATALAASGVGQGDMVLYQLYNSPQFSLCYIAPQKLGAINSPINFNLSSGETARLIDRDTPKVYVYDCDVMEMAWKALEMCSYKPEVILAVDYRNRHPQLPEGHIFFDEYLASGTTSEPVTDYIPDMYAEVTRFGTSGTTGMPKGVPINNVNEVLSAHTAIMHFPLSPKDVTLNMTPWFHRGGLHCGGMTPTFYVGGTVVILRLFNAKSCFDCVRKYGVTYLIGVPSALKNLAARQEKHPEDLSGLRGIVTMGSPLNKDDCIRYQQTLTPNLLNGYGTTETFVNTFLRPYDLPDMSGYAGFSCIEDDVRVVRTYPDRLADPDDLVPNDGVSEGEVIVQAVQKSALCYAADEVHTREKYRDGWFYTKDIATWDENHYVRIVDRKDDMIICMGENIYPAQLEEIINRHPKVHECMVIGVEDPSRGESVAAYIIPEDDSLTIKELNSFCTGNQDMAGYMCPRYFAIVNELPYTPTGKKQHVALKKQAKEDLKSGKLLRP